MVIKSLSLLLLLLLDGKETPGGYKNKNKYIIHL